MPFRRYGTAKGSRPAHSGSHGSPPLIGDRPRYGARVSEPRSEHTIAAIGVVMDCTDPTALADFWQAAIGFEVRTGDGDPYVTLSGSRLRRPLNHLTLQRVPEPKAVKNRTHIDLFAGDVGAEVE